MDRCRRWFFDRYYPAGPACPDCGAKVEGVQVSTFTALRRFTCAACGQQPRAIKGTILQDSKFDPRQLVLLSLLIGLQIDDVTVARLVGVHPVTVIAWRDRFVAMAELEAIQ